MSEPDPAFRCADAARVRADPLAGSAPPARRWLLLEHPGPWRIDAIVGAGIESDVLSTLVEKAGSGRDRLVRRPGRINREHHPMILNGLESATGRSGVDQELWMRRVPLPPPRRRWNNPALILVHSRRNDVCCALRGVQGSTWRHVRPGVGCGKWRRPVRAERGGVQEAFTTETSTGQRDGHVEEHLDGQ